MIDIINASTGSSRSSQAFIPDNILSGAFNFGASNAILQKDFDLWAEEIDIYKTCDQGGKAAQSAFSVAVKENGIDADLTTIYHTLRRLASLK